MYPFCYISLRPYCDIISSRDNFSNNQMYSYLSIGVPRWNFLITSHHRNRATFVDMVIFKRSFAVVMSDLLILAFTRKLMSFPPAKILVHWGSSFWGLKLQKVWPQVTPFLLSVGIFRVSVKDGAGRLYSVFHPFFQAYQLIEKLVLLSWSEMY